MAKYAYVALFTEEEEGGYSINFPDFESCYTYSAGIQDGMEMAEDVLALTLYRLEKSKEEAPKPSTMKEIQIPEKSFATYVFCDTLVYQKMNCNKAVKKTLSIPEWLNDAAMSANINFSQVLQEALKNVLGIA